jgi:hypothetical protein
MSGVFIQESGGLEDRVIMAHISSGIILGEHMLHLDNQMQLVM